MTTEITGVKVYWDSQDPANEGWAYRLFGAVDGEQVEIDSGALDAADDSSPADLVVRVAMENGIDIRRDECACEPDEDGGWATWWAGATCEN